MKLQILSDLHLDFASMSVETTDADVVVMAGDIQTGLGGVKWCKENFDMPVIYVPGNHEYYDPSLSMNDWLHAMRGECIGSNVHILDRDVYELGGVRFLGTTLWTDLADQPFGGVACGVLWSDADYIRVSDGECFNSNFAQSLFRRNREWLKAALRKPFEGKTVVVTHHAPSASSMHPQYAGNPWNSCFIAEMGDIMGDGVDVWIHGHTHNSFDYDVSGTRVLCNPRGYPHQFGGWENSDFNSALLVELD